jgi:protein-L-isoaspartate(D-aspartate) O-methyltransferase
MSGFEQARHNMIQQQIRPWEVLDNRVLDTFDKVERHLFVPEALQGLAYADCQLPIAGNRRMLPPTVEGRLLQALRLSASDLVLEIGCAGGYISACLASLARHVDSCDFSEEAVKLARDNLNAMNISNVDVTQIESLAEINHRDKYDAIALTAGAVHEIPQNLLDALTIDGRLFAIIGESPARHAMLVTRNGRSEWNHSSLFEFDIDAL